VKSKDEGVGNIGSLFFVYKTFITVYTGVSIESAVEIRKKY